MSKAILYNNKRNKFCYYIELEASEASARR